MPKICACFLRLQLLCIRRLPLPHFHSWAALALPGQQSHALPGLRMPAGAGTCGRLPCRPPQQPQAADCPVRLPDEVLWQGGLLSRGRCRSTSSCSPLPAMAWTSLQVADTQRWSFQPNILRHLCISCLCSHTMQPASRRHCEVKGSPAVHLQMCARRAGDGMATKAAR